MSFTYSSLVGGLLFGMLFGVCCPSFLLLHFPGFPHLTHLAGLRPLPMAISMRKNEAAMCLINNGRGLDVNATEPRSGQTCVMLAESNNMDGVLQALLQKGARPPVRETYGAVSGQLMYISHINTPYVVGWGHALRSGCPFIYYCYIELHPVELCSPHIVRKLRRLCPAHPTHSLTPNSLHSHQNAGDADE